MTAVRLAAVLLCEEPDESPAGPDADRGTTRAWREPCGACIDCDLLAAGTHPDFQVIHRRLNKLHPDGVVRARKSIALGVDVIRHFLIDPIGRRPSRGRARVFVVDEAERMSEGAQNALLKTLEEPPSGNYLVLLAPSADALLETTRSRCQVISFRPFPIEFVFERLVADDTVSESYARLLAETVQGSLGEARRMAVSGILTHVSSLVELLARAAVEPLAAGRGIQDLAATIAKAAKGRENDADESDAAPDTNLTRQAQEDTLALIATMLRDLLRFKIGHPTVASNGILDLESLAARATSDSVGHAIRALAAAEYQIRRSANTGLIFHSVGIALGRALTGSSATVELVGV